jgi:hypothetical protein
MDCQKKGCKQQTMALALSNLQHLKQVCSCCVRESEAYTSDKPTAVSSNVPPHPSCSSLQEPECQKLQSDESFLTTGSKICTEVCPWIPNQILSAVVTKQKAGIQLHCWASVSTEEIYRQWMSAGIIMPRSDEKQ